MSWDREDNAPVAVEDVHCVRATAKAFLCSVRYEERNIQFWVPKKLITEGCAPSVGKPGTLSIPLWFWKRVRRSDIESRPPPVEFEADRVYRSALVAWSPLDTISAKDARDRLRDLYLACRAELTAQRQRALGAPPEGE